MGVRVKTTCQMFYSHGMPEKPTMNSPSLLAGLADPFTLPYRPVLGNTLS